MSVDLLDDILPVAPESTNYWMERALRAEAELQALRGARTSPNGHGYEATCFGCGKDITVKRRPVPGKRSWCETCTADGEPNAQRARDYRDRKREGQGQ